MNQNYILKGFDDEQEESPSIVSNKKGELWMFFLRRLSYPENKEFVSAFRYDGTKWIETDPVTKEAGQYEVPIAACAPDGKPVVAWTDMDSGKRTINVSNSNGDEFANSHKFRVTGKSINPILLATNKDKNWIAWENFNKGKLSIYLSKYENSVWSEPMQISKGDNSCFSPAIIESENGDLYIVYGLTRGFHQNIEMSIIGGNWKMLRS